MSDSEKIVTEGQRAVMARYSTIVVADTMLNGLAISFQLLRENVHPLIRHEFDSLARSLSFVEIIEIFDLAQAGELAEKESESILEILRSCQAIVANLSDLAKNILAQSYLQEIQAEIKKGAFTAEEAHAQGLWHLVPDLDSEMQT